MALKSNYLAKGYHIIIVGSNSGIGISLINSLLLADATVFGIDIQEDSTTPRGDNNFYFQANPMDIDAMNRVKAKIEKQVSEIHGLVNLSGTIKKFKSILELDINDWNETYDISFKSCFNSCKVFSGLLNKASNAAIVNMSSGLAFIGQKNYGPYTAGKASVVAFSKTLAAELAPKIRVNTVAPGAVDTNFIYKEDGTTRFNKDAYMKMVPLKSLAKPEQISSVVMFLLSIEASYLTGQCLHVNGGAGMH